MEIYAQIPKSRILFIYLLCASSVLFLIFIFIFISHFTIYLLLFCFISIQIDMCEYNWHFIMKAISILISLLWICSDENQNKKWRERERKKHSFTPFIQFHKKKHNKFIFICFMVEIVVVAVHVFNVLKNLQWIRPLCAYIYGRLKMWNIFLFISDEHEKCRQYEGIEKKETKYRNTEIGKEQPNFLISFTPKFFLFYSRIGFYVKSQFMFFFSFGARVFDWVQCLLNAAFNKNSI